MRVRVMRDASYLVSRGENLDPITLVDSVSWAVSRRRFWSIHNVPSKGIHFS